MGPLRGPGSKGSEGSKGGGSALRAMNIKSALRDLLSVSYGMIRILMISRYAAPPLSGCAFGHTFGVRVDGALPRGFLRFLGLTALWAEGCGGGFAADF